MSQLLSLCKSLCGRRPQNQTWPRLLVDQFKLHPSPADINLEPRRLSMTFCGIGICKLRKSFSRKKKTIPIPSSISVWETPPKNQARWVLQIVSKPSQWNPWKTLWPSLKRLKHCMTCHNMSQYCQTLSQYCGMAMSIHMSNLHQPHGHILHQSFCLGIFTSRQAPDATGCLRVQRVQSRNLQRENGTRTVSPNVNFQPFKLPKQMHRDCKNRERFYQIPSVEF